jgi:hypothetical protein
LDENPKTSYKIKDYEGRYAKDEKDTFIYPLEFRKDKQIILNILYSKNLYKNTELKLSYTFERNSSNDSLYDYKNNIISLGLAYWF